MKDQGLIAGQTKAVNRVFVLVVGLAAFMWSGTLIDKILGMGWAWDRQILWLAPSMVVFAALVRFCTLAIFNFVGRNS